MPSRKRHGSPASVGHLDELLALDIDAVVNLLPGPEHFAASKRILESGRHLVTEKPIMTSLAEPDELLDIADRMGLYVVAAPADMLAGEWRRARDLIERDAIGKVAFARVQSSHAGAAGLSWPGRPVAVLSGGRRCSPGPGRLWPDPGDRVLGPARRVSAMSGITVHQRRARGGPFDGMTIPVMEPDRSWPARPGWTG